MKQPPQRPGARTARPRSDYKTPVADLRSAAAPPQPAPDQLHELQVHQLELRMQNEELRRVQLALVAARDRYLDLYDFAPVGYLTLDSQGVVVEANLKGAALLGADRGSLKGTHFAACVRSTDSDRWHLYCLALARHGNAESIELELRRPGGREFHGRIDGVRVAAQDSGPMLRITLTDITQRKLSEAELRLAATAFEAQEGIMITDARGVIERVNRAFTEMTGYEAEQAVGQTPRLLHSGRQDAAFYAAMWASLHDTGAWRGELWNRRRNGDIYPQWLTISAVRDDDQQVTRYVGTMQDISQRKAREEEIAQLAFYDPLTGLPNRRLMKDRLQQALAISARSGREGALMFIDLDHFKHVNDTLGHDKGDILLQQVAQRLTTCVREGDTVARLGGDEFVVMLAADLSVTPTEAAAQAKAVGEKILAVLHRPYGIAGREQVGSASIGVALFSDHVSTVDELLMRADQAMYQAKTAGRNALRFFDSATQRSLHQRATLEAELRHALQQAEFVLFYQPAFDRQLRLRGAEALLRWQHPVRGLVEPDAFITVAEEAGLIQGIGQWVLESVCAQLALWAGDPDLAGLRVSVNISALQLRDRRFVPQVLEVLDRTGAMPRRLQLELTESMMLDDLDGTIAKMQALKECGVGFSLDDFGTGYASLSHLKHLPLDQLKIDRSFVQDLLSNPRDAAIARTIVDLGHSLGLTVIAEGVETEAQRDMLAEFGCHAFQGHLFGTPRPVEALVLMARQQARRTPGAGTGWSAAGE